jgi:hypothetical protein
MKNIVIMNYTHFRWVERQWRKLKSRGHDNLVETLFFFPLLIHTNGMEELH